MTLLQTWIPAAMTSCPLGPHLSYYTGIQEYTEGPIPAWTATLTIVWRPALRVMVWYNTLARTGNAFNYSHCTATNRSQYIGNEYNQIRFRSMQVLCLYCIRQEEVGQVTMASSVPHGLECN